MNPERDAAAGERPAAMLHPGPGTADGEPLAGILMGPTAAGKTALAVELAALLPVEIISADSRQVYRHLDIGTAKPTPEERAAVPHHLIDFLELDATYNAARFAADALQCAAAIRARGRIPLVVGGAGFYLKVLEEGLFQPPYSPEELQAARAELATWSTEALQRELKERDPVRAAAIHPNDRYRLARALEICVAAAESVTALTASRPRVQRKFVKFRLTVPRPELHRRIAARAQAMLDAGWAEEVRAVRAGGAAADCPGLSTLGYPHLVALVEGRLGRAEVLDRVGRDTHRFARHQETWFRKARDATLLALGDPQALPQLRAGLERAFAA
jgi:tRNA dimethylallyltransferase